MNSILYLTDLLTPFPVAHKLSASNIKQVYAPSAMQESMLDSGLDTDRNQTYFRQETYRINGDLQPQLVEAALAILVERHDSLRTVFSRKKEDRWLQVVLADWPAGFYYEDLRAQGDQAERDACAALYKTLDRKKGFDCTKESLLRVAVLQLDDQRFELIWSYHHAIVDGWSIALLMSEYGTVYTSLVNQLDSNLPKPIQYGTYIDWLTAQDRDESGRFWQQYLADYTKATGLPNVKLPASPHPGFSKIQFTLPARQVTLLTDLARQSKTTFSVVIQAVWGILLSKLNNTSDAVFGLVISGRPSLIDGVARIVGLFINTVPVRLRYDATTTMVDLLETIQADAFDREAHDYCSPAEIKAQSELKQHLFDHILSFGNFPAGNARDTGGDNAAPPFATVESDYVALTDYDFNINVTPGRETRISFDFNPNVYEPFLIDGLADQFQHLIGQILTGETVLVDALTVVTPAEKERLLALNPAPYSFSPHKTLPEQFAATVTRFAAKTALIHGTQQLTYAQLERKSNQLARYLMLLGVQPQTFVAVLADRSILTVMSLLAIQKVGAIYVPIDADLPTARINYILGDTQAKILLTDRERLGLSADVEQIVYPEEQLIVGINPTNSLPVISQATDVAYVIYTSGTTGTPKGVLIKQESIVDRVLYHNDCLPVTSGDTVLQFSSVSFDASLVEMLMALLAGGTLLITDNTIKHNPALLLETINEQGVTVAILPPAYLQAFDGQPLGSLRKLISTGEAARLAVSVNYAASLDFFNGYGPTEACVGATFYRVDAAKAAAYTRQGSIPIGLPFANTAVYVLNDQLGLMPVGHAGEICVAGIGLSVGYLNQPEQTNQKFVPNPYTSSETDTILYKTGDLGRWTKEGILEFIGRRDDQIQVRGIRVEPAEIEAVLTRHDAIRSALLAIRQTETSLQLIAYLVADGAVGIAALRDFAARWLPTYMLPTHVVQLDAFPLTINGKIDRRQLPVPDQFDDESLEGPVGPVEHQLATIWMAILDKTAIGRHANFFEIGGHSLKATRLISRIYREMGVKLALNDVFLQPTLARMADLIGHTGTTGYERIHPCPEQALYALSHAQKGVWLAHQHEAAQRAYNVMAAYWLTGDLNTDALTQALAYTVRRHESLRTSFTTAEGMPMQRILPADAPRFGLVQHDISHQADGRQQALRQLDAQLNVPFDLATDPLIRVTLLRTGPGEYLFTLMMHHIICDAWSKDVLTRDIITSYNTLAAGRPVNLAPLPIHYKDFAAWQQHNFSRDQNRDRAYWTGKLANPGAPTTLPADYPRPKSQSYAGAVQLTPVDPQLADQLRQLGGETETSLFIIGVAAVYTLLHHYTGQEDLLVGTTVAGRDHDSLDEQIGFYINTLALRTHFWPTDTFETLLNRTKETTLDAYRHQHYPFDLLVADAKRDSNRRSLFDVLVELINIARDTDNLPGMRGVTVTPQEQETHFSKHELAIRFFDNGNELAISLEYNADLFESATITRFGEHLIAILDAAATNPAAPLADLALVDVDAMAVSTVLEDSFNFNF